MHDDERDEVEAVRWWKVEEARRKIATGYYEIEEPFEEAIRLLLIRLNAS